MTRFSTLALDLATVTGWAVHSTGMNRPFFGSLALPGGKDTNGAAGLALWNFLCARHRMHQFTHIVIEAQHVGSVADKKNPGKRKMINVETIYKLIGLGMVVEMFCEAAPEMFGGPKILCYKVHIGEWRKHFIGKGGNITRAQAKQMCIAVCEALGWDTLDDNAAEATGILDYFMTMLPGEQRPWRDVTFMGGRAR